MATPRLSEPIIFTLSELKCRPTLTTQMISLVNDAFRRSKLPEPEKWFYDQPRFPTIESYYEVLDDESLVVVIYDEAANSIIPTDTSINGSQKEEILKGKLIGCSGAIPWLGGVEKEGAGNEVGWEVKAISVDGDKKYLKTGLAVRMVDALTQALIEKQKRQNTGGWTKGLLTWWIIAAECLNGPYWRRKGFQEVRHTMLEAGAWGCKTTFDVVVLRKDIKYDIST